MFIMGHYHWDKEEFNRNNRLPRWYLIIAWVPMCITWSPCKLYRIEALLSALLCQTTIWTLSVFRILISSLSSKTSHSQNEFLHVSLIQICLLLESSIDDPFLFSAVNLHPAISSVGFSIFSTIFHWHSLKWRMVYRACQ